MNEQELGKVAEIEFKKRAIQNGFIVSSVINDRGGYDYIIDCGDRLTKVQVKSTSHISKDRKGISYPIGCLKNGNKSAYDKDDFDFLMIYLHVENLMYIIPIDKTSKKIRLFPYSKVSKYNKYIDAWDLIRL